MPPKAARGRGASRGRGRGRGRGVALEEPPAAAQDESASQSQSTLEDSPPPKPEIRDTATDPRNELDDDTAMPSPNSSPATMPTETPAPTPVRAPAARSESSSTAAATSTRGARGRGGALGGSSSTRASKFKPKSVRRNQGERDRLAEEEQKRKEALMKKAQEEADRKDRAASRLRGFRGGRGRGDVMGRGAGRGTSASGLFGVAPQAMEHRRDGPVPGRPSGGSGGGTKSAGSGSGFGSGAGGPRVKSEGAHYDSGTYSGGKKIDFHEPLYPDFDGDDSPRIDIEQINRISDDDSDEPIVTSARTVRKGKSKTRASGLKPVRLHREEHKERVTIVKTESQVKTGPQTKAEDDAMEIDEVRSSQVEAPAAAVRIKTEPAHDLEDQLTLKPPTASSAELKKRTINLDAVKKARRPSKKRDQKPVIQTEEDRAEYERHLEDVRVLAEELGGMQTADSDMGATQTNADAEEVDQRLGRLYLFQFPPVLPKLYNPRAKSKPQLSKPTELAMEGDTGVVTGSSSKTNQTSGNEPQIKSEEAVVVNVEEEEVPESNDVVGEEGWIGKLIVRESGRVELSWGGTSMVVGRGVESGFLSTGVVVDSLENGVHYPNGEAPEGKAMGMGQIMGKFVVTPDWEKMA